MFAQQRFSHRAADDPARRRNAGHKPRFQRNSRQQQPDAAFDRDSWADGDNSHERPSIWKETQNHNQQITTAEHG
jgi:hypothetical protein